jgi:hypothetical protein
MVSGDFGESGTQVAIPAADIGLSALARSGDRPKGEQIGSIPMHMFRLFHGGSLVPRFEYHKSALGNIE